MRESASESALTDFQVEVLGTFFGLPESAGFLLAGGAALIAQRLVQRPTDDLDLFTTAAAEVGVARDALVAAAQGRGWATEIVQNSGTFCRLILRRTGEVTDSVLVDLAQDSPPTSPSTVTLVAPTFAPEELAGRKLLALFDRAEARDFADVYQLAQRFNKQELLHRAIAIDSGFDETYLAEQFQRLARFTDERIPIPPAATAADLRGFFAAWRDELLAGGRRGPGTAT